MGINSCFASNSSCHFKQTPDFALPPFPLLFKELFQLGHGEGIAEG